jgi:hypothetical protein
MYIDKRQATSDKRKRHATIDKRKRQAQATTDKRKRPPVVGRYQTSGKCLPARVHVHVHHQSAAANNKPGGAYLISMGGEGGGGGGRCGSDVCLAESSPGLVLAGSGPVVWRPRHLDFTKP